MFSQSFWDDADLVCEPSSDLVRSSVLPPFEGKDTSDFDDVVLETYMGEIDPIFDPLIAFCGGSSFNVQNPVFYKLTATESIGFIQMDVLSCTGGDQFTGLQISLLGGDRDDVQVLYCDSDPIRQRNYTIQTTELVPGEEYYLILDGYASSVCTYRFKALRGFGTYEFKEIDGVMINGVNIEGNDTDFCKSADLDINVMSDNEGFKQAEWQIADATTGEVVLDTISYSNEFRYTLNKVGSYTLNVDLVNDCSRAPAAFQAEFNIQSGEDEILDPFVFCLEDFPDIFHPDPRFTEPIIDLNATQLEIEISNGSCSSTLIAPLAPIAPAVPTVIEKEFCGSGPHTFEGITFAESNSTQVKIENGASTGCDSLIIYEFIVVNASGDLQASPCGTIDFSGNILRGPDSTVEYQWTDASGNEVTDSDGDDSVLTIEASGEYGLQIMIEGADGICSFDIGRVQGMATDFSIQLTCQSISATEVELTWSDVDLAMNYTLLADGATVDVLSSSFTSYTYAGLSAGQEINFQLVAALPGGCDVSGTTTCGSVSCADLNDVSISIVETSRTVCLDPNTSTISFTTLTEGTVAAPLITWQSTGVISAGGVFDPVASGAGTYSVMAILTDGTCEYQSEEVIVNVTSFDMGISFNITETACENKAVILSYEGPLANPEDYRITVEGNPEIIGELPGDLTINWLSAGEYQLNIIIDNGQCRLESDIKTVIVDETELVETVRANANSASVTLSWTEVPCATSYALYVNDVYVESTAATSYVYVFKEGENEVELTVDIDGGSCICTDISPMTLGARQLCPIIRIDIEEIGPLCLNDNANLDPIQIIADIKGIEKGGESIWTGTGVNENGVFFPNLAGVGSHTITIEYIEAECPFTEQIIIEITDKLEVDFDIVVPECFTESSILNVEDIDNYMVFVGDDQVLESGFMLPAGSYQIEFADENGCSTNTEVNIDPTIELDFEIIGATEVREGFNVEYVLDNGVDEIEFSEILWSFNGDVICDVACSEAINFTSAVNGELCADMVLALDGCRYQECVDITVLQDLKVYIPNSFMANALPPNDRFKVNLNNPNTTISTITIFDRIGNQVYTEGNISSVSEYIGWDGTNQNNDELLSGVYVYFVKIIDEEGKEIIKSGDVTFLR